MAGRDSGWVRGEVVVNVGGLARYLIQAKPLIDNGPLPQSDIELCWKWERNVNWKGEILGSYLIFALSLQRDPSCGFQV